jgi:hypothetical protein
LFETSQYQYRVFVTGMSDPIDFVVWFLQPARRRGKPDQGGKQRCRAGGASVSPL